MTSRATLLSLLTLLLSAFGVAPPAAAADVPPGRMNVLFVTVDDLRNDLGCYGHKVVRSPNIDRLAARGVRFDRAYCQYPVCNPSRTSFMTGLRPDSTRILDNGTHFRTTIPDVVTLPQLFRQNGYVAASLGKVYHRGLTMEDERGEMDDPKSWDKATYFQATKLGLTGEGRNLTGGKIDWCRWLAAEGADEDQPDGQVARAAVELLEQNKDKPFFLAVGFHKPHDPFHAPKKYFDLYPPDAVTPPAADPADVKDLPLAIAGGPLKKAFDKFTDRDKREFMRAYYAGTSFIDAQLGKVLDALDRLGLADKTVVVLLGDHGYHLGERGWWNKSTLFEHSARAPLVVCDPRAKAKGAATSRLVEFLDLYPTMADVCGLTPPTKLEGTSFRPLLSDPNKAWKPAAYTQVQRGKNAGRSVRTGRWRYTEWDGGVSGVELYDHENVPGEYRNLAGEPAEKETLAHLKTLLNALQSPRPTVDPAR